MEPAFVTQMDFRINEDSGKLEEAIMKMNIKVDPNTVNTDAIINIQSSISIDGQNYRNPIYVDDKSVQFIIPTKETKEKFSILCLERESLEKGNQKNNAENRGNFPFKGKYFDLIRYLNKQDPELTYTFYGYSVCHPNTQQYNKIVQMLSLIIDDSISQKGKLIDLLQDKTTFPISLNIYEFNIIKTWNEIIPIYNSIQGSASNYVRKHPFQKKYLMDMVQKIQKLHRMGIVHCRLIPENIILLKDGTTRIIHFENSKLNGKVTINDENLCVSQGNYNSDIIQWYIGLTQGDRSIRSQSSRKKNQRKKTGKRGKRKKKRTQKKKPQKGKTQKKKPNKKSLKSKPSQGSSNLESSEIDKF